jgi:hypothetical protein
MREEDGRKRQEERIREAMRVSTARAEVDRQTKKSSSGPGGPARNKRKKDDDVDQEEPTSSDDDPLMSDEDETASSQPVGASETEGEAEVDETPLSSQDSAGKGPSEREGIGLQKIAQPRARSLITSKVAEVEGDGEEELPVSTARRRYRAGFIIDSDDDE